MGYVIRKFLLLIPVLFVVSFLTFLLLNLLPGDPTIAILGPGATTKARAELRHQLNLDQSLPVRYTTWVNNALHGDLGKSYINGEPVSKAIGEHFPITLELLIISQVIALILAIPIGIVSAVRPNRLFDQSATTLSFGALAIPPFTISLVLVVVFAVSLHWFPATGYTPLTQNFLSNLNSLILPSIALALGSLATYMRVLRADMISTLQQDFITMARSKGLPTWRILSRHAFRPSTFTLVTVAGLQIGALIGGAFIVEIIFDLPGLGSLTLNGIYSCDYLLVQGCVLVITVGYVLVNFVIDLLYPLLDPRTRQVRLSG